MTASTRKSLLLAVAPLALLLLPAIAMQFSTEVNWSGGDFLLMGALLLALGIALALLSQLPTRAKRRWLYMGAAVLVFLLIWVELAVGVFGSPFAGS